jgi:signal transduction histidine kinase
MSVAAPRRPRSSLRREVLILLPAAVLLLVVLSTFTLFTYRGAIALVTEERRTEAAQLARALAARLARQPAEPSPERLRELAPQASAVTLIGPTGAPLAVAGDLPSAAAPLAPLGGAPPQQPVGAGPDDSLPEAVAGFAPFQVPAGRRYVRVDLPAPLLAGQRRIMGPLSAVVVSIDAALAILVLLFLRRLLEPYDSLLARARAVDASSVGSGSERGGEGAGPSTSAGGRRGPVGEAEGEDEVAFLLATFDRAVETLAGRAGRSVEDDIAALERTLSASLKSGLLVLDKDGRLLALNAVGAALLGTAPAAPGTALADLLAGQPELLGLLGRAVGEGQALERQECAVRSAGEDLTLGLTVHPLRRDGGGVRGYLVLFADLTGARRQADASRLAESLASLGELAGGVAHELRNGLATLRGYLTLIERHPDEESAAGFLGEIRRESDHLQRVVEDFLSFARPGTARLEEFSLAEVAARAAADPALGGAEVVVRMPAGHGAGEGGRTRGGGAPGRRASVGGDSIPDGPNRAGEPSGPGSGGAAGQGAPGGRLRGDPGLVLRALRNLLHNAVEAQREAGQTAPVEVGIDETAEGIEVTIDDRGPGVPAELRDRLFHPFATGRPGGIGLGLALAQRIVVLHHGRIRLEDRPGGGTRARVFFPRDTFVTEDPNPGAEPLPAKNLS